MTGHVAQDFGTLSHIAALFAAPHTIDRILAYAEGEWQTDVGCDYVVLSGTHFAEELYGGVLPESVTVEVLKVTGTIGRHYHEHSDSFVVVFVTSTDEPEGYSAITGDWEYLYDRQSIAVPRGTEHGFRVDEVTKEPFHLIVVSSPPIAQEDVVPTE